MREITYRCAESNERDGLAFCRLYNAFYAKEVDLNYYRWQFFSAPFPSFMGVALADKKPIGFYGVHVLPTNWDAPAAWALDIMIHPDYQDRGIFRGLARYVSQRAEAYNPAGMFVMANPNGANAHTHGLGWTPISTLHSFVAETQARRPREKWGLTFQETEALPGSGPYRQTSSPGRRDPLVAVFRDRHHMGWRFHQNPRFTYTQFKVLRDQTDFGYLVLKVFNDPSGSQSFGDIVDLGWAADDPEALAEMLLFALHYFHRRNVERVVIWLQTNTALDQIGVEVGFQQTDQKRFFCGKVLNPALSFLDRPQAWFNTLADSEIY